MCKKKITLYSVIFFIVFVIGFFIFIDFQERKLISASEHIFKRFGNGQIDISYKSLKKIPLSLKPKIEILGLKIKMKSEKDIQALMSSESTEQFKDEKDLKNTEVDFEKILINSDLFMKDFELKNLGNIEYKNSKDSGIIEDDFEVEFGFFESPFQKKFLSESHMKNLKYIEFEDKGYKIFDVNKNLLDEYVGELKAFLKNVSSDKDYIYDIKINADHQPKKVHELKDSKEIAIRELSHAKTHLDLIVQKAKTFSTKVNFDVKKMIFKTKDSGMDASGKIQLNVIDQKMTGDAIIDFENYKGFLKLLNEAMGEEKNNIFTFAEKILPEIAEKKSDNVLSLKYEQTSDHIKIGNKDFAELINDYVNFSANSMKEKAQNFFSGDGNSISEDQKSE